MPSVPLKFTPLPDNALFPAKLTAPPLALTVLPESVKPLVEPPRPLAVACTLSLLKIDPIPALMSTPFLAVSVNVASVPAVFVIAALTVMSLPLSTVKLPPVLPKAPMLMVLTVMLPDPDASLRPMTVFAAVIFPSSVESTTKVFGVEPTLSARTAPPNVINVPAVRF